jgi:hypothetical protein
MRYPPRIRPFKSPMANVELDKPLTRATGAHFEFKVTLKAGVPRREAMAAIHHSSAIIARN